MRSESASQALAIEPSTPAVYACLSLRDILIKSMNSAVYSYDWMDPASSFALDYSTGLRGRVTSLVLSDNSSVAYLYGLVSVNVIITKATSPNLVQSDLEMIIKSVLCRPLSYALWQRRLWTLTETDLESLVICVANTFVGSNNGCHFKVCASPLNLSVMMMISMAFTVSIKCFEDQQVIF